MASNQIEVQLSEGSIAFVHGCVKGGQAPDASAFIEQLLEEEVRRRRIAVDEELLAALASGRIEFTVEQLQGPNAWEILTSGEPVHVGESPLD